MSISKMLRSVITPILHLFSPGFCLILPQTQGLSNSDFALKNLLNTRGNESSGRVESISEKKKKEEEEALEIVKP
ncbi:hypothetical protein RJT34_08123 [Clitoria ternatea]|uniref:Uncharacterized protein n=1 Tax=Clitoria ternatea TaxID=43366 RepID=A0AAN9PTX4_CLITE